MGYLLQNLDALKNHSPELKASVEQAPIPPDFAFTPGSDEITTYVRTMVAANGKKQLEWLGGTSMPRASAISIVKSLDASSNGANGLGLSIGSGWEWAAFIQKLSRPQMVFVYEPDTALLRMALEICDLAESLIERRIVLLSGTAEQAAGELARFLAEYPGFEPPTVLHPLVTAGERRQGLLQAGEAIVRHAVVQRQVWLGQWHERLGNVLRKTREQDAEAWIAFLLTPRYAQERPIGVAAAEREVRCIQIDRHDASSGALRVKVLAELLEKKGCVQVISDLFRAQLGNIPSQVAVETWVPPLVGPGYWERLPLPDSLSPADRVVVHGGLHEELFKTRGFGARQIDVQPLRPNPRALPASLPGATGLTLQHRVALIADLPPHDADAVAITLPTHQAVFAAARQLILDDYLTVHPGMAADILRRALDRAGVDPKLQDSALREPMLRMIRHVLIPAVVPLALAGALAKEGIALTLIGDWPGLERHMAHASEAALRRVAFEEYTPAVWEEVAVLAHLSPEGIVSPLLWDAVAMGVAIVSPEHAAERYAGSLSQLLAPEKEFARPGAQQFVATVKGLLRDGARRQKLAAGALGHMKDIKG